MSKSRASLVCAGCFACIALARYWRAKISVKVMAGIFISAIIISFCLFFQKDSTHGRQFILHVTWELIKEKPLAGHGPGGFHKEYMNRQEDYFLACPQSRYARLADDVRHPLNEFMLAWCDYGISGLCVIITAFAFPLTVCLIKRRGKPVWLSGTLPIFIFSLFSYPLNYPLSWIILILCGCHSLYAFNPIKKTFQKHMPCILNTTILVCLCLLAVMFYELHYDLAWGRMAKYAADGHPRKALVRYASLYGHYHSNSYFLYNYAAVLYSAGMFTEAEEKIGECQKMWNGYNIELLAGDICRMEDRYDKARMHYQHAHQMCPSRFAPLFEIFQTYRTEEDTVNAVRVARIIVCKSMKTESAEIYEMKTITGEFIRIFEKKEKANKESSGRYNNGEEAFELFREQVGRTLVNSHQIKTWRIPVYINQ
ncbi:MAG: O-antigen ligase family protein [Bacteroides sp.]|nr:O-antigen ligase family protein [Roseburia sp.]MCM1347130.1 O-antigen ligase family protein [Bacteroides sp.]MCM1421633.1 O-antigen ligase family protein [Bacteroides sp.]